MDNGLYIQTKHAQKIAKKRLDSNCGYVPIEGYVTHIIQNTYRTWGHNVERLTVLNNINARSANIVQDSARRNSKSNVGRGCLYPVLTLSSVKKVVKHCDECGPNASRKQNNDQIASEKTFDMVHVRSLTDAYIKVEDLEGRYRALFK